MTALPSGKILVTGPKECRHSFLFAHGAGAGMDSFFMEEFAQRLGTQNIQVIRYEFLYMQQRRETGSRRPPDRAPKLLAHFQQVIDELPAMTKLVIGGKSMGGRMASMIAGDVGASGLVCLGYPFHGPKKAPDLEERDVVTPRTEHLIDIKTPTLILQGDRDSFGTPDAISPYTLSPDINFHWIGDGDHDLVPRKKSGRTQNQNWSEAIEKIAEFIHEI
jgi:predicted alpha/beta-hydrolase family hydrolase